MNVGHQKRLRGSKSAPPGLEGFFVRHDQDGRHEDGDHRDYRGLSTGGGLRLAVAKRQVIALVSVPLTGFSMSQLGYFEGN